MSINGGVSNTTMAVTDAWERFSLSSTTGLGQLVISCLTSGDEVYIWGWQEEAIAYPTSLIPTEGTIKTRNQDLCTNGGDVSLINSSEGVLYAQISAISDDVGDSAISINNGGQTDRIWIGYSTSASRIYSIGYSNNLVQFVLSKTLTTDTEMIKVAVKYKGNDFALWVDGTEVATDNSGLTPIGLNSVDFTINGNGSAPFFGNTKALGVWKEALTDAELRSLTYPTPTAPTFDLDFNTIATDFTFTRNSEATFVNAQGLIQSTNEIGAEEITNGDFSNGSTGWNFTNVAGSNGWSISNGRAICDNTNPLNGRNLNSTTSLVNGKSYKLVLDILQSDDNISIIIGSTTISNALPIGTTLGATYIIDSSQHSGGTFSLYAGTSDLQEIDNVSVKEYITETNTPRLDYSTGAEAFLLEPQRTNLIP